MIVGVDVDDVCANLLKEWCNRYNEMFGILGRDRISPDRCTSWQVTDMVPAERKERFYNILYHPDLYAHVEIFDDAAEGIRMLRRLGRVVFITSCPNMEAAAHKYDWLRRYGLVDNMDEYIVAKDKSLIKTDFLIDDGVHNLRRPGGILMRRPNNRNVQWDGPVVHSLPEAARLIEDFVKGKAEAQ